MRHIVSGTFNDEDLGRVHVTVRSQSTRLTARWKENELRISAPRGLSPGRFLTLFNEWKPRLLASRPKPTRAEGERMDFELFSVITETRDVKKPLVFTAAAGTVAHHPTSSEAPVHVLALPERAAAESATVNRMLDYVASLHADILLRELMLEVKRLGMAARVRGMAVARGHRTLGRCTSQGAISISRAVTFLPYRLRRLIYCHEIAHLDEMNHSERFHRILNGYLDSEEKALAGELRTFKWPWRQ